MDNLSRSIFYLQQALREEKNINNSQLYKALDILSEIKISENN